MIEIIVKGECNSGKSTMLNIIYEALIFRGFNIEVKDSHEEYEPFKEERKKFCINRSSKIDSVVRKNRVIKLTAVQVIPENWSDKS